MKGGEIVAKRNVRKWTRAHFFKRKKSNRKGVGHPVYVYGKSGRDYKYLLFTHKPKKGEEDDYVKLKHNIDPKAAETVYMKKSYQVNHDSAFREPDVKYRIHEEDRGTVKKYEK